MGNDNVKDYPPYLDYPKPRKLTTNADSIRAMTDKQRFIALRCRLFKMIRQELERDPYCKSYEGCLEVNVTYPNYFEDEEAESGPECYIITLHCYVLGPARHYDFKGKTMKEALDKMEETITGWENGYDSAYE